MAVQTIYILAQAGVAPNFFGPTQVSGTAPTGANTAYGWVPARVSVATPYRRGRLGATTTGTDTAAASSYNASTSGPTPGTGTGATTAGDSFVAGPFHGTFANTAWTFNWNLRASTAGAVGNVNMRVWKSANADGSSATELLANTAGATVTLSTSADVNSSIAWSPGALTLNTEYLFFQVEWQETTQGANPINDVFFRAGTSSITTPDFSQVNTITWGDCGTNITLSNGNKDATNTGAGNQCELRGNIPHNIGLWYCEFEILAGTNYNVAGFGIADDGTLAGTAMNDTNSGIFRSVGTRTDGASFIQGGNGFTTGSGAIPSASVGDRIQIAVDFIHQELYLATNNVWITGSNPVTRVNPRFTFVPNAGMNFYPWCRIANGSAIRIHGDAATQTYAPPTGYLPWENIGSDSHKLLMSFTPGSIRSGFGGYVGMVFTPGTNLTFNKVGLFNSDATNTGVHNVRLYDAASHTVLQTWNVDMTGTTIGAFTYFDIPQFILAAGNQYYLAAGVPVGSQTWCDVGATGSAPTRGTTPFGTGSFYSDGVTYNPGAGGNSQYYGVDLDYVATIGPPPPPTGNLVVAQANQTLTATGNVPYPPRVARLGGSPTVLLCHGDGTAGSTTFIDDSFFGHALTPNSGAIVVNTTTKQFGTGSIDISNNGNIDTGNAEHFWLGNGPFTLEAWVYFTGGLSGNTQGILSQWASNGSNRSWIFSVDNAGLKLWLSSTGSSSSGNFAVNWPGGYVFNAWNHLVCERDNAGLIWFFVNGVPLFAGNLSGFVFYPTTFTAEIAYGGSIPGLLDEVRVSKVARYATTGFTPPSAPFTADFPDYTQPDQTLVATGVSLAPASATLGVPIQTKLLVHADGLNGSTTFTDDAGHTLTASNVTVRTAQFKFGTGSADFTASNAAYIDTGNAVDFNFGAGQFTVEAWCYFTSSPAGTWRPVLAQWGSGVNFSWVFGIGNDDNLEFALYDGAITRFAFGVYTPTLNTWTHLACDRDVSGVVRVYANGAVIGSATITNTANPTTANGAIGNYSSNTTAFPGYLDEIRVTKGLARFRGPFTPSSSPYAIEFSGQQANQTVRANNFTPTLTPTVMLSASRAVARSVVSSQDVAARTVVLSDVGVSQQLAVGPPVTATLGPIPLASPSCVLLMHADGTAGSTTFTDASPSAHTLTPTSVTVNATAKFGSGAANFTNSTAFIDTGNAIDFNFGAGQFTVEAWCYFTSTPSIAAIFSQHNVNTTISYLFYAGPTNLSFSGSSNGTSGSSISAAYTLTLNTWMHLAVDRDASGNVRFYQNGVVLGTQSFPTNLYPSTTNGTIGNTASASLAYGFTGYLDEIRVTKGRTMYGGAFTPPTQPFSASNTVLLVHADGTNGSTTFIDSSLNANTLTPTSVTVSSTAKFGSGSANFAASIPSRIDTGNATDFNFGAGPFTVEAWAYVTGVVTSPTIAGQFNWSGANEGWAFWADPSTLYFTYTLNGTSRLAQSAAYVLPSSTWVHLAIDRDASGNLRFYANGSVLATILLSNTLYPSTLSCIIGNDNSATDRFPGCLDEIRVAKGVARYAGAFTPPTTAYPPDFGGITQANQTLSAITANLGGTLPVGTVLLVHADGVNGSTTFTDIAGHTLTATSATVNTASPKFGNGSVDFTASTGSVISIGGNATDFNFGSGPFTIEAWCYFTATPTGDTAIVAQYNSGISSNIGFAFGHNATTLRFLYSTSGTAFAAGIGGAHTLTLNTWVHLAVDRDVSNNLRLYVDGTMVGLGSPSGAIFSSTLAATIGNDIGGTYRFPGRIDEILVIKGVAKYATNSSFTPASAPYTVGIIQDNQTLSATGIVPVSGAAWFYRSLATGTGDGMSWANARTSLTNMTFVSAGDPIWVADDHVETSASNLTITLPGTLANPNIVVCADHTVASPGSGDWRTSALVTTTSGLTLAVNGSAYFYGIGFSVGSGTSTVSTLAICGVAGWQSYDGCSLQINGVTVLLCHFDGTDGSTTFIDSSPLAHTLTPSGTVQISTTNPKIGTGSANFSGSPYIDTGNATDFQFGAGPFTIEAWVYPTALSGTPSAILSQFVTSGSNNSFMFAIDPSHLFFYYSINGSGTSSPGSAFFSTPLNTWTHVAVDRNASNVLRLYANGTVILSATVSATLYPSTLSASVGNPQYPLTGRLDELRVTKGVARYGGAFTPPTAPFTAGSTDLIQIGDTTSATKVVLNNTTLRFSAVGQMLSIRQGIVQWRNTANAIAGTPPSGMIQSFGSAYQITCDGVDLGVVSGQTIVSNATVPVRAYFNNCRFDAYASSFGVSTLAAEVFINDCDTGNSNYRQWRTNKLGFQRENTAIVRTGGASDGTTPISWLLDSSNSSRVNPFESLSIDQWNTTTGSPLPVAVRGILFDQNSLPDSSQIWMEAQYLGSGSTTLASFVHDGLSNWAAVPAVLVTADTSAWDSKIATRQNAIAYSIFDLIKLASNPGRVFICTGSGTSNATEPGAYATAVDGGSVTDGTAVFRAGMRFKMSVILTPQLVGSIFVTVKVGDSSVNPYIDPLISVS